MLPFSNMLCLQLILMWVQLLCKRLSIWKVKSKIKTICFDIICLYVVYVLYFQEVPQLRICRSWRRKILNCGAICRKRDTRSRKRCPSWLLPISTSGNTRPSSVLPTSRKRRWRGRSAARSPKLRASWRRLKWTLKMTGTIRTIELNSLIANTSTMLLLILNVDIFSKSLQHCGGVLTCCNKLSSFNVPIISGFFN